MASKFVKGRRTGYFVSPLFPAGTPASKPPTVTFTADAQGDPSDVTLTLSTTSDTTLFSGVELDFSGVTVKVTETTVVTSGGVSVPVAPLTGTVTASDTADWDGLVRITSTEGSTASVTEGTQNLQSITYDDGDDGVTWDETDITSKAWTMDRQGRFRPTDSAYLIIEEAGLDTKNREVWVERILPDEDGDPARYQRGRAKVTGFSMPAPANGLVDASWTFTGQGVLETGAVAP